MQVEPVPGGTGLGGGSDATLLPIGAGGGCAWGGRALMPLVVVVVVEKWLAAGDLPAAQLLGLPSFIHS